MPPSKVCAILVRQASNQATCKQGGWDRDRRCMSPTEHPPERKGGNAPGSPMPVWLSTEPLPLFGACGGMERSSLREKSTIEMDHLFPRRDEAARGSDAFLPRRHPCIFRLSTRAFRLRFSDVSFVVNVHPRWRRPAQSSVGWKSSPRISIGFGWYSHLSLPMSHGSWRRTPGLFTHRLLSVYFFVSLSFGRWMGGCLATATFLLAWFLLVHPKGRLGATPTGSRPPFPSLS